MDEMRALVDRHDNERNLWTERIERMEAELKEIKDNKKKLSVENYQEILQ